MTVELFRKRPTTVQVVRWWKDGDDPDVHRYWSAAPEVMAAPCVTCSRPMSEHGWINQPGTLGKLVCPGSYVVEERDGSKDVLHQAQFVDQYERAPEPLELTEAERAALKTSLHASTCHVEGCTECAQLAATVRQFVGAAEPVIREAATGAEYARLHAEGRLLQQHTEYRQQYVLLWDLDNGTQQEKALRHDLLPSEALDELRKLAKEPPEGAVRGRIRLREHWAGPWTDVEAVEVPCR